MDHAELLGRVRELRGQGKSPKQIARALGMAPSAVAPLVRAVAAERPSGESELVGSWVNVGWSAGLAFDPSFGWTDEAPRDEQPNAGMVSVLVARRHGYDKVSVCGYLADVYCLGVKHAIGPQVMDERELSSFREYFFGDYAGWRAAPLELARQIVLGSIEYARGLGFEPTGDFAAAQGHLGEWEPPSAITFGRDGRPCYVPGPEDDARKVLRTLERTVGEGKFDHLA
ncbi:helix-turn-helix domain containing protein [Thermoactinospora rubra]|uniref:helix-turn-helix domain containing protein n=1 Tax=Thermoactinospora rubra TaxID=1088767 RepID=UPI000A10CB27|nr:helix-turn-helix domain containing protein [Thermoactinospora rubra]